ncbi:3'-5' exoribonuclease [Pseudomonas argentinensis]|uniref:Exodeoxyribonuclease VIII n=1 Tax=Phytopseudomonas argentinensis TaxID=289370 RepID=A0A1I3NV26_9GAMM|nr:3'-5' exonuclease [Pseudomonas argentinensis]KAB0549775.1 3'-5' exoribonuclease [Pseudomonas argentinensis]SFJ13081.1 exodeoxyribonuclease VIII [Pseudomonas argentinensis]
MTPTLQPIAQALESIHPLLRATHYVLDLETLGKGPNAAIATIGCVRIENGVIGDGLYIRVDVDSAIGFGGETDASTIDFWLRQSEEAQREIHHGFNRVKINNALIQLADFIDRPAAIYGETYVWGNGATFDNVIISTAFQRAHVPRPWPYWNDRDLRTIVQLYPEAKKSVPFVGLKHHALDDAMHEARILVAALKLHIARSPA